VGEEKRSKGRKDENDVRVGGRARRKVRRNGERIGRRQRERKGREMDDGYGEGEL
jgi:hypothetical protein